MVLAIVIEPVADRYSAYAPDFPGCVGLADTADHAEQRLLNAVRAHMATLAHDLRPVPCPKVEVRYARL
jgi:predicted RNase H-like HicB family nuclease